jgi:glycosyltransferase involved in cell wall biosynthesis
LSARRLSVCYVVPGHDLLASIGPSRNVINLAGALSQWADVTLAFNRVAQASVPPDLRVLEIQPGAAAATIDDAAMKGAGYGAFFGFLRKLRRFVDTELTSYDIVLEKSWLLSGYVSSVCRARGQLGVPIENIVPDPRHAAGQSLAKLLRLRAGRYLAGRNLRGAPLVIAETEFLRKEISQFWHVPMERIAVVDLGVDRKLFRHVDVAEARAGIGLAQDKLVLVYVGVLDKTHNLEPLLRALKAAYVPGVELHVVGDGARRKEYEAIAAGGPVVFHGRVTHESVPRYIAAGDLCVAPYDASAFSSGELGYSTMKIPEYLSVGRAVASVPSGRTRMLVRDGETGFLFYNDVPHWQRFLANLPDRERLRRMGAEAGRVPLPSWDDTARRYLSLCEEQLQRAGKLPALVES